MAMNEATPREADDRRNLWQMPPRPPWLAQVNALGATMDMRGVIPLDEHSLLDAARRNTGLDDFGDTEWLPHFRRLLQAMEEEAKLNFFGRVLTRSDLLVVNKTDLAPYVGVDLTLLEEDTKRARGLRPYVLARLRQGHGVDAIVAFLEKEGGLALKPQTA